MNFDDLSNKLMNIIYIIHIIILKKDDIIALCILSKLNSSCINIFQRWKKVMTDQNTQQGDVVQIVNIFIPIVEN